MIPKQLMPNYSYTFSITIDRDEYLRYYAGAASSVRTPTHQGVVIEFPANALKPWITHSGISGTFCITMSEENKLLNIERL